MNRYLNMFNIIGVVLVGIGIAGLMTGSRFLAEPGQAPTNAAALYYMAGGAVMLINGYLSMRHTPPGEIALHADTSVVSDQN